MASNYRGLGARMPIDPGDIAAAVTAGDLVNVGATYGVALDDAPANGKNVMAIEDVWELAKATGAGTGGSKGDKANATGGNLITAGAGTYVGHFHRTAGDNDTTALVKLLGFPA